MSREEKRGWIKAHSWNKDLFGSSSIQNWDVVLLGDGVVEEYQGRVLGTMDASLKNVKKYWDATFSTEGGGDVEGLALGIAGDSVRSVLFLHYMGGA